MNGMGTVVDTTQRDAVVVRRFGDGILSVTLALELEIVHIISMCAPQLGLGNETKKEFWGSLVEVVSRTLLRKRSS